MTMRALVILMLVLGAAGGAVRPAAAAEVVAPFEAGLERLAEIIASAMTLLGH